MVNIIKNRYCFIIGFLAITFLWLSLDGHMYWHEIRFLYASSQFSLTEILAGEFNPHQLGGTINELGAGGFYLAKVLHIGYLHLLFRWIPPAAGGLTLSVWLSVLGMLLSMLAGYKLFLRIFENKHQSQMAVFCLWLMPITPYLAGKLLSEVTALFLITISIWIFAAAIDAQKANGRLLAVISGIFLLLAALARLDIILSFFGFFVALLLGIERKDVRIQLLIIGGISLSILVIGYLGTIEILGGGIQALVSYFRDFTGVGIKSSAMSILGLLTFGGLVYILAFGAIFSQENRQVRLLAVWFVLSASPAILITWNYMVEPRYLIHGLLPLGGLGALGLEVVVKKMAAVRLSKVWSIGGVTIIIVFNYLTIRLMPYELDRPAILEAVNQVQALDTDAVILTPWAYTDFHFLRIMRPDVSIINVNSLNGQNLVEKDWQERFDRWYGQDYISSASKLEPILAAQPTYYLGWRKYPPLEYVRNVSALLGLVNLNHVIDDLPLTNHLAESWVWHSSNYRLELVGKYGQYEYYRVTAY